MPSNGQITIPSAQVDQVAARAMQLGQIVLKDLQIRLASLDKLSGELNPESAIVTNPRFRIRLTPEIDISVNISLGFLGSIDLGPYTISLPSFDSGWQNFNNEITLVTQALGLNTTSIQFGPLSLSPSPITKVNSGNVSAGGVDASAMSFDTGMMSLLGAPLALHPFSNPTTGQVQALGTRSLSLADVSVPSMYVPDPVDIPQISTGDIQLGAFSMNASIPGSAPGSGSGISVSLTFAVDFDFQSDGISLQGITGQLTMQGLRATGTTFSAELQEIAMQELQLFETIVNQINIPI